MNSHEAPFVEPVTETAVADTVTETPMSKEEYLRSTPAFQAHQGGLVKTMSDGTEYTVRYDGSWKKTKDKRGNVL